MVDPIFAKMISSDPAQVVKPVFDPVNNKLYFQTDPFLRDGKVIVKRLAEYDVEIEKAYNIVEEYSMTTEYGKE